MRQNLLRKQPPQKSAPAALDFQLPPRQQIIRQCNDAFRRRRHRFIHDERHLLLDRLLHDVIFKHISRALDRHVQKALRRLLQLRRRLFALFDVLDAIDEQSDIFFVGIL